ncbi:MAG: adenosylcobinamide-GDP ribazoletransferase [Oscillospiraceae bacterium]|nr:adenosylcobinamide-GDP ribazoletransferase [Oscillospiraceae bacterium]
MKKAITGFFMSWGMFCSIPCPLKIWDEKAKLYSVLFIPFIGAVIGAVWAALSWLLGVINAPSLLTAAIITALPYLLSGFIHLDGFMDCSDAILSRRDLAERQRILKDSHTGAFAVICVVIVFLIGFGSFASLGDKNVWTLIFISAAARCPSAIAVMSFQPIGHSGYAKAFEGTNKGYKIAAWCVLAVVAVLPVVIFGTSGLCAIIAQAAAFLTILYGKHQLGGMSGDISGYGITVGELVGAVALVLL